MSGRDSRELKAIRVPDTIRGVLRRVGLTVALLTAGLCAIERPARAEDAEKARQLFQQGSKYYDVGQFDKAVEAWQAGYEQKPDPSFLFNIAQAYRQKEDLHRAIFFYKSYLRNSPKAANRAEVEQRIAALQKQLNESASRPPQPTPPTTPPPPATAPPPAATSPTPVPTPAPPAARPALTVATNAPNAPPPVPSSPPMGYGEPAATAVASPMPGPLISERRFDVMGAVGSDFWSSGVQGKADPSFAFTVAGGYTFGDPASRFRFRLGALVGYTFLKELESRETFWSFVVDPTLEIRLGSSGRWYLYFDVGIGGMSISGLKSTSALLDHSQTLMVSGSQGLALVRLGAGLHFRLTPELALFAWPAVASSPKKTYFFDEIVRNELLFGIAYRL